VPVWLRSVAAYPRTLLVAALADPDPDVRTAALAALTAGQAQRLVEGAQAPRRIGRVDRGRGRYEQDHVHFKDGQNALNRDGTWKHGGRQLTNAEQEFMRRVEWNLPDE
jgi:hypothetical protein